MVAIGGVSDDLVRLSKLSRREKPKENLVSSDERM